MIEINLLPEHLREVEHTPYPRLVTILVGVMLCAVISIYSITAYMEIESLKTNIQQNANDLADKKIKLKEVQKLKDDIKSKELRRNILIAIVESKIMWSRKLDQFNKLINDKYQDSLWFDGISISGTQKSNSFAPNAPIITKLVATGHFILDKEDSVVTKVGELQKYLIDPTNKFSENVDQNTFKIDKFDFRNNAELNKNIANFPLEITFEPKSVGDIGSKSSSSKKDSKKK